MNTDKNLCNGNGKHRMSWPSQKTLPFIRVHPACRVVAIGGDGCSSVANANIETSRP
jgi:hypothetical protein